MYVRSPHFVGMGASPDYIIHSPERGVGLLEIKNVDWRIAKDGWSKEEAPVHIELQIQHQLECSQLSWGAIGGLIGGNEAQVFERERDTEVGAEIGNRVMDMLRRVRDNDPPGPNYLDDFDVIKRIYRDAMPGKVMDLSDPAHSVMAAHIKELCAAERAADAAMKLAEEDKKRAQAELIVIMNDHERVSGMKEFRLSAVTVHTPEQTVTRRASSYRRLTITPVKESASA
ncbi:hypothetical protein BA190_09600 [Labrys sp. WJW]|nr:hypothetical protein BA190_09600 [Labrys sp. WJW]